MSKGFLELGLKLGETVRIGDEVSVTIVRIEFHGNAPAVGIGISAPKEVSVKREEIYNRINGIDEHVRRFPVRRKPNQPRKVSSKATQEQKSAPPLSPVENQIAGYVSGVAVSNPKMAKITVKKSRKLTSGA